MKLVGQDLQEVLKSAVAEVTILVLPVAVEAEVVVEDTKATKIPHELVVVNKSEQSPVKSLILV